jgi:hypothetical protein
MAPLDKQNDAGTEHANFEHVGVLLAQLRLGWLLRHFSPRLVWASYVGVNALSRSDCWLRSLLSQAAHLSFRLSARPHISSSFRRWQKPPAHAIPSLGTLLDLSLVMLPSRL